VASIREIVSKLESTKNKLGGAKTSADGAGERTGEMATQAEGMDLEDAAKGFRALRSRIDVMGERIVALGIGVDELVETAEALRRGGGGRGARDDRPTTSEDTHSESRSGPTSGDSDVHEADSVRRDPSGTSSDWVSPSGHEADQKSAETWTPEKEAPLKFDSQGVQKKIRKVPKWRERLLSKYGTEMTAVIVGGVSGAASQLTHLPPVVQASFTTFLTMMAIRKAHQESKKDDD
jgi:hypothetical protein